MRYISKQLKITTKLNILIIISLILLIFWTLNAVVEKYHLQQNAQTSLEYAQFSLQLANLVRQLQKERGLTAGVIGSQGRKYLDELSEQQKNTDKATKSLTLLFEQIPEASEAVLPRWHLLSKSLASLGDVRPKLYQENYIEFYSQKIIQSLDLVAYLRIQSMNPKIINMVSAYSGLLWIEEYAGLERAALNLNLAKQSLSGRQHNLIKSYIAGQQVALRNYNNIASDKHKRLLEMFFSHTSNVEVEQFRSEFSNSAKRVEVFNRLQSYIGFGGLIHDFKNYVLSGKAEYLTRFSDKFHQVTQQIGNDLQLPFLSSSEKESLNIILNTVTAYYQQIESVRLMHANQDPVIGSDKLFTIDDKPALEAVKLLSSFNQGSLDAEDWWYKASRRLALIRDISDVIAADLLLLIEDSQNQYLVQFYLNLFASFVLIMIIVFIALKLRRRIVGDVSAMTAALKANQKNLTFYQPLEASGGDELAELFDAFNLLMASGDKSREKMKLFLNVFTDAHEGIVITDIQGNVKEVNPAFCNMTGFTVEELKTRNPFKLGSNDRSVEAFAEMWRALNKNGQWQGELWNHKKNGELFAERATVSSLKDEEGNTTHYVALFSDISQNKQYQKKLESLAHYDALTGLPNRHLLNDRFVQAVAHGKRSKTLLAVCFLDLDNFKPVNDEYGHEVGDKLLTQVSNRIQLSIREEDTLSRVGGDEFVILLGGIVSAKECELLLSRIVNRVAEPFEIEKHEINVSVSIGVTFCPLNNTNLDILIRYADQAMYQAKQSGRNRYQFFSD
jgi:diguanylate cyclase (GGDEF)-like protein/PAS domain S-box-containing protein